MKTLLVTTDLSERAALAVARSAELAKRFDSRVVLLHVIDGDQPPVVLEEKAGQARQWLQEHYRELSDSLPRPLEIQVRSGLVDLVILETADELSADLLIMGAHRKRRIRDILLGTTLERVLRARQLPILVVQQNTLESYHNLLLSLDLSPVSSAAFTAVSQLGLLEDSNLTLVHAYESFAGAVAFGASEHLQDYTARSKLEAANALKALIQERGLNERQVALRIEEGLPIEVIRQAVKQHNPHLLILGSHGLDGLNRFLLGSVAEAALNSLGCDILVIPDQRPGHA